MRESLTSWLPGSQPHPRHVETIKETPGGPLTSQAYNQAVTTRLITTQLVIAKASAFPNRIKIIKTTYILQGKYKKCTMLCHKDEQNIPEACTVILSFFSAKILKHNLHFL